MQVELTDVQCEFLKVAMAEAINQANAAPYAEAVEVLPVFNGILEAIAEAEMPEEPTLPIHKQLEHDVYYHGQAKL